MTIDLFEDEQRIYDSSVARVRDVKNGIDFDFEEYELLTMEYGRLLKQLRRSTRIADRTTINLYESNLDLTDKIHFDVLTGIYNRRFIEDNLKRVTKSMFRSGGELSVLMIDIDFFKKYNDTYGHIAGDACLKSVAKALSGSVSRSEDFVARYGGEEFTIVLPSTKESGARLVANKILENVRALNIAHEKNNAANCVTISVGAVTGHVTNTQCGTDYIRRADIALYMSKQTGRNKYTYLNMEDQL